MAEAKRDYYEVLGVDRDADAKTIKRAFLKKARVMHPDVSDDPDAEAQFKEINEAYTVLSDDAKRANYDRYGDPNGPGGFGGAGMDDFFGGFDMSDLFSEFFGGGRGASRPRTRGRDMTISMRISLQEAATGVERTITYDRLAPCEDCGGTGSADGSEPETCPDCGGSGVVTSWQHTILGRMQTQTACPTCHGTGQVVGTPCETCDGQGRAPSREKVTVQIPAGVRSGQSLVIQGAGEAGVRGEAAGDLVVTVEVEQSDQFVRQGDDLACAIDVDAFEAMLGAAVDVPGVMPDETVTVEVPAGTQPQAQIVVPGKGMPRLGSPGRRGRLVCVVNLVVPRDLSDEQQAALTALARERGCRVAGSDETLEGMIDEVFSEDKGLVEEAEAPSGQAATHEAADDRPAKKPRPTKKRPFGKRRKKK